MTGYLRKAFDPLRKTAQYRIAPLLFRREEYRYFVHRTESRPQGYHILDIQKGACHLYFPGDRTYVGVLLQRKPRLQHQYLLQFAAKRQPVRYLSGHAENPSPSSRARPPSVVHLPRTWALMRSKPVLFS